MSRAERKIKSERCGLIMIPDLVSVYSREEVYLFYNLASSFFSEASSE